jgi:hypothetical protein
MSICPNTGVRDFPIRNLVKVTDTLVSGINESFMLSTQWEQRSTAPQFDIANNDKGFLQEGTKYSSGTNVTTLRFQGNSYTLQSVQICTPQHKDFVLEADKPNVMAEVLLCFSTPSEIAEKYVIFCVPVLNSATTTPNIYLTALANDRLPGGPISLETLLPPRDKQVFISYSTCLSQLQGGKSVATQARVLVFYKSIVFPNIKSLIGPLYATRQFNRIVKESNLNRPFPAPVLPNLLKLSTMAIPFTIDNETSWNSFLRSGNARSDLYGTGVDVREDTTSAYKCTPLNPDVHISNNIIKIDTQKGEPLISVLEKRKTELQPTGGAASVSSSQIENLVAAAIGITLGIIILSILAYLLSRLVAKEGSYTGDWFQIPDWVKSGSPILVVSLFVGFFGFGLGLYFR